MGTRQEREMGERGDSFSREKRKGVGFRALGSGDRGHLPQEGSGRKGSGKTWACRPRRDVAVCAHCP